MNTSDAKYTVLTVERVERDVSLSELTSLADMSDAGIEGEGFIPESVRSEYKRHLGRKRNRCNYSVIVVATQTSVPGKFDYAAYHLESEGGTLATQAWKGRSKHYEHWERVMHFVIDPDMSWGVLSDTTEPPICWRTSSNVFVSCELSCDDVANDMLDIARAVAYPEEYLVWVSNLCRQECEAVRAKTNK